VVTWEGARLKHAQQAAQRQERGGAVDGCKGGCHRAPGKGDEGDPARATKVVQRNVGRQLEDGVPARMVGAGGR